MLRSLSWSRSSVVWLAVLAVVPALAAVAMVGGCGGKKRVDPDHPRTSCAPFGASDDRTAFAYLDEDKIVVRTAAGTRSFPRPACMERADRLFVAPRGTAIAAHGSARSMPGDLWGHSSKVTTANCVVDLATGREEALDSPESFAWIGGKVVEVHAQQLPTDPDRCRVFATSTGTVAACDDQHVITVRRFVAGELTPTGEDLRIPMDGAGAGNREQIVSPDGKWLAYWGEHLRIVELASGSQVAAFDDVGALESVQLDPTGADRVMLVSQYTGATTLRRVRVFGFDGAVHYQGGDWKNLDIYWTEPLAFWEVGYCSADRRLMRPRWATQN